MTALTRAQIDADILAAVAAIGYSSARIIYDTDAAIYAAGMERAAKICDEEAITLEYRESVAVEDCADAIRAAAKGAM